MFARHEPPAAVLRSRWRSVTRRLDGLSPFWTAYFLTLTETVGATILALPISIATVGPLAGAAVLLVLGAINALTVAYLGEAIARSGRARYGSAYLGRLVADYLGRAGSATLSIALFTFSVLILPVYYLGVARTLESALGVPAAVWVLVLFGVGVLNVRRPTLGATINSAYLIGTVNVAIVLVLCAVAFAHVRTANLTAGRSPFGGGGFDASVVALLFGVGIMAYFGHTSVAICGRLVLRREPTGRALVRGCVAAELTAAVLYCLFVVAVNGAVPPAQLARESGTALVPFAHVAGAGVAVLGSLFAVLGMGMASITYSIGLFRLVSERLPSTTRSVVRLPRRGAALGFRERGRAASRCGPELAVTYLGTVAGRPRLGVVASGERGTVRLELPASGSLELAGGDCLPAVLARVPELGSRANTVHLEVLAYDRYAATLTPTDGHSSRWQAPAGPSCSSRPRTIPPRSRRSGARPSASRGPATDAPGARDASGGVGRWSRAGGATRMTRRQRCRCQRRERSRLTTSVTRAAVGPVCRPSGRRRTGAFARVLT